MPGTDQHALSANGGTLGAPLYPGRVIVAERALSRVAQSVSAEALGVDRRKLTLTLSTGGAGLIIQIRSPLPVPDLDDDAAVNASGPIIDRLTRAQATIRERAARIMGRPIARVNIRIDSAEVAERRRVL